MADVINDAKGVANTFSSWDSCMSKTYCKWPVIAAIIIGSLIVLSVLWCIFSCLCCGMSLCGACVKCLTCNSCCRGSGGSRRRKDPEYNPMPPTPTPYQNPYHGYQPPAMMYNAPQTATFETGNKRGGNIHEDSLPAMPSWDSATTRRVEDHSPQPQRGSHMEMEPMLSQNNGPRSPVHESPYSSDMGAQRLNHNQNYSHDHSASAGYYDDTPMSPAPTYYSTAPAAAAGAVAAHPRNQQFSPVRENSYNNNINPYNQGPAPYPSSRESTQFAAHNARSMSPPQPYHNSYNSQAPPYEHEQHQQQRDTRPPSLLQVGRKPVPNSYREV